MREWTIREEGYEEEKAAALGNRYLTGNGYLGIRGTLEEYEADRLPAINLAGIYDRSTGWREPVNLPNGCFSYLRVDGEMYRLPEVRPISHGISLDYRHGIFHRHTTWHTARGNVTLRTERFAGMDQVHVIGMRFQISADFHADIELVTGIDTKVWDLNGPHLEKISMQEQQDDMVVTAQTHEEGISIAVAEGVQASYPAEMKQIVKNHKSLHRIFFITMPGETYTTDKWITVFTGKDVVHPRE